MKIGKINVINFGGLWSFENKNKCRSENNTDTPIIHREVTYHPFKDETQEEIQCALDKAKSRGKFACYSSSLCGYKNNPIYYIVQTPKLGEKIKMTKDEYAQVADMQQTDKPVSNQFLYYDEIE